MSAEMIIHSGETVALDRSHLVVSALAIEDGLVSAIGTAEDVEHSRGAETQDIDLGGATVIPGLNDSHLHLIRGGLNYLMELRWEGVPSLSDALVMLKEQADRTPAPQWVRVIGGWSEFQFAERRLPTLAEINAVSPHTPVLVLHLYVRALLNQAALRTAGRGSAFRAADWGAGDGMVTPWLGGAEPPFRQPAPEAGIDLAAHSVLRPGRGAGQGTRAPLSP